MTGCEHESLSRMIDGELTTSETARLREHLERCTDCADAQRALTELDALCREVFPRAIYKPRAPRRRRFPWLPLAAGLAVLIAAGLAYAAVEGLLFGSKKTPEAPPSVVAPPAAKPTDARDHAAQPATDAAPTSSASPAAVSPAAPSRIFSGIVRNSDNEPITHAKVVTFVQSTAFAIDSVDAEGRFACKWLKGADAFTIVAPGYKTAFFYVDGAPEAGNAQVDVCLFHAVPVKGRVVDEQGAGIAGVTVAEVGAESKPKELLPAGPVVSNANGDFELPTGGDYTFTHSAYAKAEVHAKDDMPLDPVVLSPGGALRVVAVCGGKPVPSASVTIRDSKGEAHWTHTGPEGSVVLESLPLGDCTVSAGLNNIWKGTATVAPGSVTEFRMEIEPGQTTTVRGKAVTSTGEPVTELLVRIERVGGSGNKKSCIGVVNNKDGSFELPLDAAGGCVSIEERSLGRVLERHPELKAPETPRWTVKPGEGGSPATLSIVFGANDALNLRKIHLLDKQGEPVTNPALILPPGFHSPSVPLLGVEATGGALRVPFSAECIWAYDAEHSMLGFNVFDYRDQQDLPIQCTIPATKLRGRVLDRYGKAVPYARVATYCSRNGDNNCILLLNAEADREGRFTLGPVIVGDTYRVEASAPGYGFPPNGETVKVIATDTNEVSVPLWAEDAVIDGTIVDDDGIVEDAWLEIQGPHGMPENHHVFGGSFHWNVVPGPVTLTATIEVSKRKVSSEPMTVTAPAKGILLQVPFTRQRPEGGDPGVEEVQELLRQLGRTFKLAADANKGAYPSIRDTNGRLVLDLGAIQKDLLPDPELLKRFEEGNYCYLGYAVTDDASGQAFLDWYEQSGAAPGDQSIEVPQGAGNGNSDRIFRLKEGIERFLITDINDPTSAARIQASIPVLWELPGNHAEPGGSVLFMDGHVEWISYPGPFPMTPSFIERMTTLSKPGKATP